jgi:Raf kinase inhibitor-like YbhB/YbcL family protein
MNLMETSLLVRTLDISSSAFKTGGLIPEKYTCDGQNIIPPLDIRSLPYDTRTLALVVDDPDAPVGTWVHWLVWNIPVSLHLKENKVHGIEGVNDFQQHHYAGPCPPSGTHRYYFKIYALDDELDLPANTGKLELEKAMKGHILGYGELIGIYRSSD